MKKTYSIPTMEVVEMKVRQNVMLVASGTTDMTSGNLSRESGFFEDGEY